MDRAGSVDHSFVYLLGEIGDAKWLRNYGNPAIEPGHTVWCPSQVRRRDQHPEPRMPLTYLARKLPSIDRAGQSDIGK